MRLFCLSVLCSCATLLAQTQPADLYVGQLFSGERYSLIDLRTTEQEGSIYWQDNWTTGTVKLKNGHKVDQYPLRYDLKNGRLEIQLPQEVKSIPVYLIAEFYLMATDTLVHFVDLGAYYQYYQEAGGFYEIVAEGPWTLLRKPDLIVREGHYEPALDMGRRNDKVFRKDHWFLFGKGNLIEIPKHRPKALRVLRGPIPEIERWELAGRFRPREVAYLRALTEYLNAGTTR